LNLVTFDMALRELARFGRAVAYQLGRCCL